MTILCQQILGAKDVPMTPDPSIDLLDLHCHERGLRALSRETQRGRRIRILLRSDQSLDHGSILFSSGDEEIVANILPCPAFVIHPQSPRQAAEFAYEIGNRHMPMEIGRDELLLPAGDANEAALVQMRIPFEIQIRRIRLNVDALPRITLSDAFKVI